MLRTIERSLNVITTPLAKFLRHTAGILLLIMVVVVFGQVLFRYLFNLPLSWTDELSRFLMIYMTYLCLPFIYLTDKNIAMTFVTEIVEKKFPRIFALLSLIGHIAAILVFAIWVKFGWAFLSTGSVHADSLPIQMYFVYIAPPIMMVVTMLYAIQKIIACLRALLGDFEDVSQISETERMFESL
ncbi:MULTISPECIES: TRAP transporter small permease [Vibrio]|uniref:TRAP transporter small permease protein n=1 Tax=Vibrio kanaloae TaxID=170673 RepID=A0A4V5RA25_9VIBR|nr:MULTISPECIES: TRAP transporter small permease [Vibrio]MCF7353005.1 TRAP transporter small permease [Vibrio sp. CK2-1]TKE97497.1 TRAP transporter small permease [Vibrio kanaloae]TKF17039.1 TRAP transporter small permease [Vibrio kanaloae]TKF28866.1 TRAP transporter small permease [Vibrio kanaloae]TKF37278.1 TRAP transporter small permease [Vibrio kanaloae]